MEKPIAVGDLVQVVRYPCCGLILGHIFQVEEINTLHYECHGRHSGCGAQHGLRINAIVRNRIAAPLEWLKRIPPLDELESTKTDEPVRETA